MTHTPGPWNVSEGYLTNGKMQIGFVNRDEDARLIAAAPDLLAALQNVVKYWEIKDPNRGAAFETSIHRARAALAKATGE